MAGCYLNVPLDKVYIHVQAVEEPKRRAQEEAEQRPLLEKLGLGGKHRSGPEDTLSVLRMLGEYLYRRGEVFQAEARPESVDPQEALAKHRRLVLLSAPGAGKSTLVTTHERRTS
jgi:predicted NACHT family NTPase